MRLGWSHGDQEIFRLDELVRLFDIDAVNQSASAINPDKLLWLNQHYLKTLDPEHVATELRWHLGQLGIDSASGPDPQAVVLALRERSKTLRDMAVASRCFYVDAIEYDAKAEQKQFTPEALPVLQALHDGFRALGAWDKEALHAVVIHTGERLALNLGKVAQPLRVALTGTTASPPIDDTLLLVGRERSLARIEAAMARIGGRA